MHKMLPDPFDSFHNCILSTRTFVFQLVSRESYNLIISYINSLWLHFVSYSCVNQNCISNQVLGTYNFFSPADTGKLLLCSSMILQMFILLINANFYRLESYLENGLNDDNAGRSLSGTEVLI